MSIGFQYSVCSLWFSSKMNRAQPRRNLLLAQGTSKKHFRNKSKYEVSTILIKIIIFQCYTAVPSMAPAIRAPNAKTKVEVLRETVQQGKHIVKELTMKRCQIIEFLFI